MYLLCCLRNRTRERRHGCVVWWRDGRDLRVLKREKLGRPFHLFVFSQLSENGRIYRSEALSFDWRRAGVIAGRCQAGCEMTGESEARIAGNKEQVHSNLLNLFF